MGKHRREVSHCVRHSKDEAVEALESYVCEMHPEKMAGEIEISEAEETVGDDGTDDTDSSATG